ncbi:hypothetical protein MANY_41530 [Mycolicibacterium anyangense]|uniref:Outer membrane protein n=2 Tax=Mycolicibacterium anyangense TaxID=1431246 RepID=A0A6N4WA06_9MYCO|nr:hypothetical protein MANY_41530 [Mycolicibacterium anyangense]
MTMVKGRHRLPSGAIDSVDPAGVELISDTGVEAKAIPAPAMTRDHAAVRRGSAYLALPLLAFALAVVVGILKWLGPDDASGQTAVVAAAEATTALLSYQPATVDQDLDKATDRLTGSFRAAYAALTKDTVIPDAKRRQITAVATVPGAAEVSAGHGHAVVLVFVNQTTIVGDGAPTNTNSSVRVTLDRVGGRWLISAFDPI